MRWRFATRNRIQLRDRLGGGEDRQTYGEIFRDVILYETDVSGVTGASAILVNLVLVAVGVCKGSLWDEAGRGGEGRSERDEGDEEKGDFSEHGQYR